MSGHETDLKLSARDEHLIEALKGGQKLCEFNSVRADDDGTPIKRFFLEPTGKVAHGYSVRKLMGAGMIRPADDGLFPGFSQTYELAE